MPGKEKEMERHSTRSGANRAIIQMVVSSMMLALALLTDFICEQIPGLNWPNGGTITPAMLPLFLAGLIGGPFWGFAVSLLFGLISFFISGWGYNWVSVLLDYIVGFGVCGVCGFFSRSFYRRQVGLPILGMVIAGALRFVSSFFSGCLVMWDANGSFLEPHFDAGTVTYSAVYNLGYIIPCILVSIVLFLFVAKPLFLVLEDQHFKDLAPQDDREDGVFGRIDLKSLAFVFSLALVVLSGLSMVPTIHYSVDGSEYVVDFLALAYIALILGVLLVAYGIYLAIREPAEGWQGGWLSAILKTKTAYLVALFVLLALVLTLSSVSLYLHYAVFAPLE